MLFVQHLHARPSLQVVWLKEEQPSQQTRLCSCFPATALATGNETVHFHGTNCVTSTHKSTLVPFLVDNLVKKYEHHINLWFMSAPVPQKGKKPRWLKKLGFKKGKKGVEVL